MDSHKRFGFAVFRLVGNLFSGTDAQNKGPDGVPSAILMGNNKIREGQQTESVFTFHFDGREFQSDSISELAEIAIREVEAYISDKLEDKAFLTYKLPVALQGEFQGVFKQTEENPEIIELYTDTFRRAIQNIRRVYGVHA